MDIKLTNMSRAEIMKAMREEKAAKTGKKIPMPLYEIKEVVKEVRKGAITTIESPKDTITCKEELKIDRRKFNKGGKKGFYAQGTPLRTSSVTLSEPDWDKVETLFKSKIAECMRYGIAKKEEELKHSRK